MGFGDDFLNFFGKIGNKVEQALGSVFDFGKGVVNQIVGTPAKLIETIGSSVQHVSTAVQNVGSSLGTAVSTSVSSIAAVLPDVSKNVGDAFSNTSRNLELPLIAGAAALAMFFIFGKK